MTDLVPAILAAKSITVRIGAKILLDNVSLSLQQGEIVALVGPNGAGKSTLLDAVCGRRRPVAGTVRYRNEDITRRSVAWRRRQGMARSFQRTSIFQDLTVHEQLHLVAQHLVPAHDVGRIEVVDEGQAHGRGLRAFPACR